MDPAKPTLTRRDLLKLMDVYNQRFDVENEIIRTGFCIRQESDAYIREVMRKLSVDGYPVTIKIDNVEINLENGFHYYL